MDERVIDYLQGYARANDYMERERMERLARLTPEESWRIFRALVETAQGIDQDKNPPDAYTAWRLESMIAVRKVFLQLAQAQGHI